MYVLSHKNVSEIATRSQFQIKVQEQIMLKITLTMIADLHHQILLN